MAQQQPMAVVLWGAHRWGREDVICHAHAAGLDVWLATDDEQPLPTRPEIHGTLYITDEAGLQAATAKLNRQYPRWCSVALDDFVARPAARLAGLAPVPTVSHTATHTCCQKHLLRQQWNELCARNKQLQPVPYKRLLYSDYTGENLLEVAGTEVSGQAIIKPNDYAGSVGVALVRESTEAAITNLLKLLAVEDEKFSGSLHVQPDVLIEQAIARKEIPGSQAEFTLHMGSLLGEHVLLATSEKALHPNSFIETGHRVPAPNLSADALQLMEHITRQLLESLGVQNTISNWEYIITPDDKIALVEGQLRPSGDSLMTLINLSAGEHPYSWFFRGLLNGDRLPFPAAHRVSGISWLWPKQVQKQITDIIVPQNLPKSWHIHADRPALLATQNWPGPADWYQRHLSITGTADTYDALNSQMQELAQHIKLVGSLGEVATTTLSSRR